MSKKLFLKLFAIVVGFALIVTAYFFVTDLEDVRIEIVSPQEPETKQTFTPPSKVKHNPPAKGSVEDIVLAKLIDRELG